MTAPLDAAVVTSLALPGLAVAFFHAAIPTHWLPFVLVSRARRWSRGKTLAVVVLAGLGHVLVTTVLGFLIAWFGFELNSRAGQWFPWAAAGILFLLGGYYLWRQARGGVMHHHAIGGHHAADEHCGRDVGRTHLEAEVRDSALVTGDAAAIGGLFLMLTLSPCEGFLPIYLSGVRFGWNGFALLSTILAVGALGGMLVFSWLALVGVERFPTRAFERHEAGILGTVFLVLGVIVLFIERG
jgi:ABC-type nickel/cobalt efflux system permease component RcnA